MTDRGTVVGRRIRRAAGPVIATLSGRWSPRPPADRRPALTSPPEPLIFPQEQVVVSWSPKCACTHVTGWFLQHQGLLDAARYYSPWIHDFRSKIYYGSVTYRSALEKVTASEGAGHTLVRITRDPTRRMASIFRHVIRSKALWPDVERRLGISVAEDGLSLRDFDRYLGKIDLTPGSSTDHHLLPQSQACWDLSWDRVITFNIDEGRLERALQRIDDELELRGVGMRDGARNLRGVVDARRYARPGRHQGIEPIEDHRFRKSDGEAFPQDELRASPLLRDMVGRHHGIDLGRVGTGDSAGRLFKRLQRRAEAREGAPAPGSPAPHP